MSGEVLALCQCTALRKDASHTFWGLATQPAPRPPNLYGSSAWHRTELVIFARTFHKMPAIVCAGQDFQSVSHQKHPLALNFSSCNLVVTRLPCLPLFLTSSSSISIVTLAVPS